MYTLSQRNFPFRIIFCQGQ